MAEQGENLLNGNLPKREVIKCQAAKRHRKMPLFLAIIHNQCKDLIPKKSLSGNVVDTSLPENAYLLN